MLYSHSILRLKGNKYSICIMDNNGIPDSKVHVTNMGPTWVLSALSGPMLAPWTLLSEMVLLHQSISSHNACRIKTGHSNLVSCFGPRMKALAKVFYRGESRGKIPCQRPNPRAKTWHKIWMTGLNPNYDTTPIPSLQNSQNKSQKSSFTYDHRRHLILPLPPVHALPTVNVPTCCQGAPISDVTISNFDRTDNLNP